MLKLESIQYQAALSITGAWKGTFRTKLYVELGWEWLSQRRWYRRMSKFHNIVHQTSPTYLTDLLHFRTLGRGNIDPLCPIFALTEKVQMSFSQLESFHGTKLSNMISEVLMILQNLRKVYLNLLGLKKKHTVLVIALAFAISSYFV